MKRSVGSAGASDVLQRLGRPGFPKGMVVLLVGGAEYERVKIEKQMSKLCYKVTCCATCDEARMHLASSAGGKFDIILAEATLFAKESSEGQFLLEAAGGLPLVLVSAPGTMSECVWRGIEVGAAEVLEKPLSLLKLQNIWQHVVRKVMDGQESMKSGLGIPSCIGEDVTCQMESSAPLSRRTHSSSQSAVTAGPCPPAENRFPELEVSIVSVSGSLGKDGSVDASVSNTSPESSFSVDGPLGGVSQVALDCKPAKKLKRSKDCVEEPVVFAQQQNIIRANSAQHAPISNMTTVMGMVHPSWASSHSANQAFRGSVPPGCVWGTPLNPPPGWQGMLPNGSGPLLGSAAAPTSNTFARCHSAPVTKAAALSPSFENEGFPDLDPALMVNLTDDLFLNDDFLDCGDNFLNGLGSSFTSSVPAEPLLELPPIGLTLKKSESLVNLINQHLGRCQIEQQGNAIKA